MPANLIQPTRDMIKDLRRRIVGGELSPGDRLPAQRELVRDYGLSLPTVHRAVRTLARSGFVRSEGAMGTFVSDHPPHRFQIAVVFPPKLYRRSLYHEALRKALPVAAAERSFRLLTYDGDVYDPNDPLAIAHLNERLAEHEIGGMIFVESDPRTFMLMDPQGLRVPRVAIGPGGYGEDIACVSPDVSAWDKQVMAVAAQLGMRRPATLHYAGTGFEAEQWIRCAREHGMELKPAHMQALAVPADQWASHLLQLMFGSGSRQSKPDGLIVADDNLIAAVSGVLEQMGSLVPRGLPVVSHCNYPVQPATARAVHWFGFDIQQLAGQALDLITQMQQGKRVQALTLVPPMSFESFTWKNRQPSPLMEKGALA